MSTSAFSSRTSPGAELCMLPQSLRIHMYADRIDLDDIVFSISSIPSGFYCFLTLFFFLFCRVPWVLRGEFDVGLGVPRSPPLCTLSSCDYLFPGTSAGSFSDGGWARALAYEYRRMSLG